MNDHSKQGQEITNNFIKAGVLDLIILIIGGYLWYTSGNIYYLLGAAALGTVCVMFVAAKPLTKLPKQTNPHDHNNKSGSL